MTESAFISIHFLTEGVNGPGKVNLNYDNGIISSITVTKNAISYNNLTELEATDIESVLEQVESVRFNSTTGSLAGELVEYDLDILSSAYYSQASNPFFYFIVEPFTIPNDSDTNLTDVQNNVEISLTPFLIDLQFAFSEYNALLSNASENRKSVIRVESNRVEDSVLPTNWEAIISGSAFPATVQDSLYNDTGWIRARYNGSKLTTNGNSGISPSINGTPFTGEIFSSDADNAFICSSNRERVNILEMLHTSNIPLPTFASSSLGVTVFNYPLASTPTTIQYTPAAKTGSINVGDIVKIRTELMRVQESNTSTEPFSFTVQRAYANTPVDPAIETGDEVFKIGRFDLFKFEDGITNIRLVNNSKIYVEGNNTVVDTDDYGQVVSQFQCEYIEYIVTD